MGKLHQHLAVESDLKSGEDKIRRECIKTFTDKTSHFDGLSQIFNPIEENTTRIVEDEKHIVDTVVDKLEYTQKAIVKLLDFNYQKEKANTVAKADIIVEDEDGNETTIKQDVPATMLLNLESRLKDVRTIYNAIPTCDPNKRWVKDASEQNIYITEKPETRQRTKKTAKVVVKYEATKEHPAQTEMIGEDVPTGTLEITHKSGRLTPATKSKLLDRIDTLIRGVKKARQRANDVELESVKIGKELFNYIHG